LRISDIKNLRLNNVNFVKKVISITQVKTDKPLTLHLLPDVGWAIIDYIKHGRPQSDSPEIFVRHVVPYTSFAVTDSVAHIIGKYANAAGINKPLPTKNSFHMLRYGLASELLQKKISLTTISGILGHSELNVTTTYTKIDVTQLRACALEVPQ
jgi:site-specific recombinase XerD